ncbi:MAG: single-stranded DNA-binding protein [Prevotella sp.]|nr:single-stranded DNA-binding protein [Candidatus Prevotella equi]
MSFQRIEVMGAIGKNAEVKTINGKQYLAFSVAVGNGKDAQGQPRPSTWFDVLYNYNPQTQEWLLQRLVAKSIVYVDGRVSSNGYVSKNSGEVITSLNIFANTVEPNGIVQKNNQQMPQYAPQMAPQPYQQMPQGYPQQPVYPQAYPIQGQAQMPPQGAEPMPF